MRAVAILLALTAWGCASDPYSQPYLTAAQEGAIDQQKCVSWGAAVGSPEYVACRTSLTQERAAFLQQEAARQSASAAMYRAMTPSAAPVAPQVQRRAPARTPLPAPTPIRTTCFARGESASGMNKICYYDCLGSRAAITQSSVSICPLTIEQ